MQSTSTSSSTLSSSTGSPEHSIAGSQLLLQPSVRAHLQPVRQPWHQSLQHSVRGVFNLPATNLSLNKLFSSTIVSLTKFLSSLSAEGEDSGDWSLIRISDKTVESWLRVTTDKN